MQFTRSAGPDPILQFVLIHHGMRLPFSMVMSGGKVDPVSRNKYLLYSFEFFGPPFHDHGENEITADLAGGESDLHRWRRIAAEAILIFGNDYNGLDLEPDYTRVELDGRLLTRRDFGYPG